mgnify:CR=1 FL=1
MLAVVLKEPIDRISMITPWNFPFSTLSRKLPIALAAGCTGVVKPFELTPSRTIIPGERLIEAGHPAGVVHIGPAPGLPAGAILANHPGVDMAAFTGSTALCRRIAAAAVIPQKKVAFERCGRNGPVIFPDADLAAARIDPCLICCVPR